jgi:hypothetical protein
MESSMDHLDLRKRDMTVIYGERTFALRAYRQDGAWRGVIIENCTPIPIHLEPTLDSAGYFAAAVAFIAASVDASVESPR